MPSKPKKSKISSRKGIRKGKLKETKAPKRGSKTKKKVLKIVDPIERAAALSKTLNARLYFQRADLVHKKLESQKTHDLYEKSAAELREFKRLVEEASAFTTLQDEHIVDKLTERIQELQIANRNLTTELRDLKTEFEKAAEVSKTELAARDTEIKRLTTIIKNSYYKYEMAFNAFTEHLVEKLSAEWEKEQLFVKEFEDVTFEEIMK